MSQKSLESCYILNRLLTFYKLSKNIIFYHNCGSIVPQSNSPRCMVIWLWNGHVKVMKKWWNFVFHKVEPLQMHITVSSGTSCGGPCYTLSVIHNVCAFLDMSVLCNGHVVKKNKSPSDVSLVSLLSLCSVKRFHRTWPLTFNCFYSDLSNFNILWCVVVGMTFLAPEVHLSQIQYVQWRLGLGCCLIPYTTAQLWFW